MKLTDKCKADFEKWYRKTYHNDDEVLLHLKQFYNIPPSMQFSVLVDFYRSINLIVKVNYDPTCDCYYVVIIERETKREDATHGNYHVLYNGMCDNKYYKEEEESREKAIEKANKIYNGK